MSDLDKIKKYETLVEFMESIHKLDLVIEYRNKIKELKIRIQCEEISNLD
jgi:hypothetical protein